MSRTKRPMPKVLIEVLTAGALKHMLAINARDADWLLFLRLLRLVSSDVPDPEEPGEMIGVVRDGHPLTIFDLLGLFPSWTSGQLRYRLRKLVSSDILIRCRTREGWRFALRFSNASGRKRAPEANISRFPWLRKPVQLQLFHPAELSPRPIVPAVLPSAA